MTSLAIDALSSAISVARARMRRATERMAALVAVCSVTGADVSRNRAHLVTRAEVVRPRSWSLRSTGAVTTRAFSWLIAAILALLRVVSNTRRASRFPRVRGMDGHRFHLICPTPPWRLLGVPLLA